MSKTSDTAFIGLHLHATKVSSIVITIIAIPKSATPVRLHVIVIRVFILFRVVTAVETIVKPKVATFSPLLLFLSFAVRSAIKQLLFIYLLQLIFDLELVLHHLFLRFQQKSLLIHFNSFSVQFA